MSFLHNYSKANPQVHVCSDASSSWGCGAYCLQEWFQLEWPQSNSNSHISSLEMIPIVMAAAVWGHRWLGLSVRFHTDNTAVVALLNQGSVRDASLMHLMRCLCFIAAKFNFVFSSSHICGRANILADALSCNKRSVFLSLNSQVNPKPTSIPLALKELLINQRPDWTSPDWTPLWNSTFTGH